MKQRNTSFKVLILYLACLCCFLFLPTCRQQECKELPDLEGHIDSGVDSAIAGEAYDYDHTIENIEVAYNVDGCKNVSTKTAGSSYTKIVVEHLNDTTDQYTECENYLSLVNPIEAGTKTTIGYTTKMLKPGFYRIIAIADGETQVEERNENNNVANEEADTRLILGESPYIKGLTVEVLPNPCLNTDSLIQLYGLSHTERR